MINFDIQKPTDYATATIEIVGCRKLIHLAGLSTLYSLRVTGSGSNKMDHLGVPSVHRQLDLHFVVVD